MDTDAVWMMMTKTHRNSEMNLREAVSAPKKLVNVQLVFAVVQFSPSQFPKYRCDMTDLDESCWIDT